MTDNLNMWLGVSERELCDRHLNNVHETIHTAVDAIRQAMDIRNALEGGRVFPPLFYQVHTNVEIEMRRRDMKHTTPLSNAYASLAWQMAMGGYPGLQAIYREGKVPDRELNRKLLADQCEECRERMI